MENKYGNWFSHEVAEVGGYEQQDLSVLPFWNWPYHDYYPVEEQVLYATPLAHSYISEPFFPAQDLFQGELGNMFDEESVGFWDEIMGISDHQKETKKEALVCIEENKGEAKMREGDKSKSIIITTTTTTAAAAATATATSSSSSSSSDGSGSREERSITFEELSRYFYMPITQAAKQLNVGLTLLKKKCRELGIPRWPHRKMKSLQTLIKNVQELGREDGEAGEAQLRSAIEILEQERRLMEQKPFVQMEEKTKRLRQACFKANYKKRRLIALEGSQIDTATAAASSYCFEGDHEYIH